MCRSTCSSPRRTCWKGSPQARDRPDSEDSATRRDGDTEAAILADQTLSGPQKFALLSIYRSFRDVG